MNQPLIAILLTTYNRPELLKKAIQSVINQTYETFECVIVNNGNDVSKIVEDFKDDRLIYINNECNKGLSAARNIAIQNTTANYFTCLDDDDTLGQFHAEFLMRYLLQNNEIVYTNAIRNVVQKDKNGIYKTITRDIPYDLDYNHDDILIQNITPVETVGFSRRAIDDVGLFDIDLSRLEDWDMWIKISRKYPMFHIPIPTCEFMWRNDLDGNSMSSTLDNQFTLCFPKIYAKYWETAKDQVKVCNIMNQILVHRGLQPMFQIG